MTTIKQHGWMQSLVAAGCLFALLYSRPALAQSSRGDWDQRYERARAELVLDHDAQAAALFEQLSRDAPTPEDSRRASELAEICRAKLSVRKDAAHLRSQEEMTV